jgi:hypothetical protein
MSEQDGEIVVSEQDGEIVVSEQDREIVVSEQDGEIVISEQDGNGSPTFGPQLTPDQRARLEDPSETFHEETRTDCSN